MAYKSILYFRQSPVKIFKSLLLEICKTAILVYKAFFEKHYKNPGQKER